MPERDHAFAPAVSILTVVRNSPDGLRLTLASVFAQEMTDWELLIKDGASTDGTAELAAAFAVQDVRVRIVSGIDRNLYHDEHGADAGAGSVCAVPERGRCAARSGSACRGLAGRCTRSSRHPISAISLPRCGLRPGATIFALPAHPIYIRYGQPAVHQSTLIRTELHQRFPYDHAACPNIADYVAVARMAAAGARCQRFDDLLATFEITGASSSYRNQAAARREFAQVIPEIWGIGLVRQIVFRARRRLANAAVRFLMR